MTPEFVVELMHRTVETTLFLAGPILIATLVIGLIVSLFQAVTQINEATLTFLPKIVVVAITFVIAFPWMLSFLVDFTSQLLINIPTYIR